MNDALFDCALDLLESVDPLAACRWVDYFRGSQCIGGSLACLVHHVSDGSNVVQRHVLHTLSQALR